MKDECSRRLKLDTPEKLCGMSAKSEHKWREEVGGNKSAMTSRCVQLPLGLAHSKQ